MSIRQEHIDVFDKSLSSLQENADLAKQLVLDKGTIQKKIETGFNLIGGLGQSYQGVQNVKTLLKKGTNTAKTATKSLQSSKEQAKTTDTGSEETPTSEPNENITRNVSTQETTPEEPSFSDPFDSGVTSLDDMTTNDSMLSQLEARAVSQAQQEVSNVMPDLPDLPGLTDSLGPMRAMMGKAQGISESQQKIMDLDPEGDITDVGNTISKTTTAVENTVDEVGNTLSETVPDVANTISSTVSKVGSGLSDLSEGLDLAAGASLELPVAGEVIALFAGIGSAIAGAVSGADKQKPTVVQTGSDFSNTDEHGGASLSAY